MTYKIIFRAAAERQLKKLPPAIQQRLRPLIDSLAENPRPPGCKKLKGLKNQYRIRSGSYRVIYSIEDEQLLVKVIKMGHRRESYD